MQMSIVVCIKPLSRILDCPYYLIEWKNQPNNCLINFHSTRISLKSQSSRWESLICLRDGLTNNSI